MLLLLALIICAATSALLTKPGLFIIVVGAILISLISLVSFVTTLAISVAALTTAAVVSLIVLSIHL